MNDATPRRASACAKPAPASIRPDFVFVCDAGHAWLLVTPADIAAVGLAEADFSPCSHRRGDQVALEEDLDALIFIMAWEKRHGRRLDIGDFHHDGDAPQRSWARYGTATDARLHEAIAEITAHAHPPASPAGAAE